MPITIIKKVPVHCSLVPFAQVYETGIWITLYTILVILFRFVGLFYHFTYPLFPSSLFYREFIWNLGKPTVYYRGLYSSIWAKTWGKSLVFIGNFSRFRHNTNITHISGSNLPFLTVSPKEKNKQVHCSSFQFSDQKFLKFVFLLEFVLKFLK